MKCDKCGGNMEAIGFSIFDVVFGCDSCDNEVELVRDDETEHFVEELKRDVDFD